MVGTLASPCPELVPAPGPVLASWGARVGLLPLCTATLGGGLRASWQDFYADKFATSIVGGRLRSESPERTMAVRLLPIVLWL